MKKRAALGWLVIISLYVLALVWERIEVTRTGYDVSKKQRELTHKTARNQHLEFELEGLKSPSRLQSMANQRLSMVTPDPCNIITLDDLGNIKDGSRKWLVKIFDEDKKTN